MRAVTVRVRWRGDANVAVREVVERGNARAEVDAGCDARVDHRDADRWRDVAAERAERRPRTPSVEKRFVWSCCADSASFRRDVDCDE